MLRSRALCPAWSGAALGDICADHRTEARGSSAGARPGPVHGAREASSRRDTAGGARGRPEVAAVSAREMSADGTSGGAERAADPEGRRGLAISVSCSMFSKAEAGRRRATLCAAWHFAFSPRAQGRARSAHSPERFLRGRGVRWAGTGVPGVQTAGGLGLGLRVRGRQCRRLCATQNPVLFKKSPVVISFSKVGNFGTPR